MKVFISTIGKVGSSTLSKSFEKSGFKQFSNSPSDIHKLISHAGDCVVHTHNIKYTASAVKQAVNSQKNCLVLVGARDLLKRHISAFYQNLENKDHKFWHVPGWRNITIAEMHHEFEKRAMVYIEKSAANWLYRFTKINEIPDSDIAHKLEQTRLNGISSLDFTMKHGGSIKYVFYQLEKLNANWSIIKDYSNSSRFPNEPLLKNEASNKATSQSYIDFLRTYTPSPHILEMSYSCDLCKFYASEEIDQQKQKWLNKQKN